MAGPFFGMSMVCVGNLVYLVEFGQSLAEFIFFCSWGHRLWEIGDEVIDKREISIELCRVVWFYPCW